MLLLFVLTLFFCIFETCELSKEMGEGKVDDWEMELVMMRRGEAALSRRGFRSLISRWWESTFTAKVVSRPVVVVFNMVGQTKRGPVDWSNQPS